LEFLDKLDSELRTRLVPDHEFQVRFFPLPVADVFLPVGVAQQVTSLASRDRHQQVPQVVAVGELWKAALLRVAEEAVKGAEGHVFLVRVANFGPVEPFARQTHQPLEIALPELLRDSWIACRKLREPMRDGPRIGHRRNAPAAPCVRLGMPEIVKHAVRWCKGIRQRTPSSWVCPSRPACRHGIRLKTEILRKSDLVPTIFRSLSDWPLPRAFPLGWLRLHEEM